MCSPPGKLELLLSWDPNPLRARALHERSLLLESTVSTLMLSGQTRTESRSCGKEWAGGGTDCGQESKGKVPIHRVGRLPRCQVQGHWRDAVADQGGGRVGSTEMQLLERSSLLGNIITCCRRNRMESGKNVRASLRFQAIHP